MKRLILAGAALLAILPMTAAARGRFGVFVGPRFGPYYGFSGWYGPYWGYPYGGYYGAPNAGQVKLDTKVKDAQVFINGNFAGTVGELKTMTMRAGDYSIEVREPGQAPFRQDIHVVAGKTMKLRPDSPVPVPPGGPNS